MHTHFFITVSLLFTRFQQQQWKSQTLSAQQGNQGAGMESIEKYSNPRSSRQNINNIVS
jgi:hypothetical protein